MLTRNQQKYSDYATHKSHDIYKKCIKRLRMKACCKSLNLKMRKKREIVWLITSMVALIIPAIIH